MTIFVLQNPYQEMVSFLVSILPDALYLLVLKILDSFALARFKLILRNMLFGLMWCALAFVLTNPACLGIPVSIGDSRLCLW